MAPVGAYGGLEKFCPTKEAGIMKRIRKDFKKRVMWGRGMSPCTEKKKKKSTKGKREPASCPAPFHVERLPSCSLKAPVRIPRHRFALFQGFPSPSACSPQEGITFGGKHGHKDVACISGGIYIDSLRCLGD